MAKADYSFLDYNRAIRSHIYALWRGYFDISTFTSDMIGSISRGFTRAWYEGAADCGILPSELTIVEEGRLQAEINAEIQFTYSFGRDILANARARVGKLGRCMSGVKCGRIGLWA